MEYSSLLHFVPTTFGSRGDETPHGCVVLYVLQFMPVHADCPSEFGVVARAALSECAQAAANICEMRLMPLRRHVKIGAARRPKLWRFFFLPISDT